MATTSLESLLKKPVDIAEYLFTRLKQGGVSTVFGVPGDYNLVALDYITETGLKWAGDSNELNAGYAADGYGRIKGLAALVTTFGVGELSTINAVAGAYSEYSPVVHIVGCPSTVSQRNGALLHHTLGNGDFKVFKDMASLVAVAVADLSNAQQAAELIDDAISKCWVLSRPVYIWLPSDIVKVKVEGARLEKPLDLSYPPNEPEKEDYVTSVVIKHINEAKKPMVLVDACAIRHRALKEVETFIKVTGLPWVTSPMGKAAINTQLPGYLGIYGGSASQEAVKEYTESSDLVLTIGSIKSDFNTAGFTYRVGQLQTIDSHSNRIKVKYSEYPGVRMNGVLSKLAKHYESNGTSSITIVPGPTPYEGVSEAEQKSTSEIVNHAWLWPRFGDWLQPNDLVVTETGTANFGIMYTKFPPDAHTVNQYLWGSIGWATGAVQGCATAAEEVGIKRTILWTGDGSFQLTAQAVSTMLRQKLAPILFVICNNGYTIERFIHGMDADYNWVQPWRYKDIPAVFGAEEGQYKSYVVKTRKEFDALLADKEFGNPDSKVLRFVEVYMETEDAPESLKITSAAAAKSNE